MIFKQTAKPILVSQRRIRDKAPHSAFTDLIHFKDALYCVFRESEKHVYGGNGCIRLLRSREGIVWEPIAFFEEEGVDLRDPKLSVTPEGKLMLSVGGTVYSAEQKYISRQSRVAFSQDGVHWTPFNLILEPHDWLWRITWHLGMGYGVSYRNSIPTDRRSETIVSLFRTADGLNYTHVTDWDIKGYPNETTLRVLKTGEMVALLRRDKYFDNHAWIGRSLPPYTEWTWTPTRYYFGGPNFIVLPDDKMWAGGRLLYNSPYGECEKTVLAALSFEGLEPRLYLPSGGDCSYPGMIYHEGFLWMSYYSSHEENSAIYLSKILLP